MEKEVARSNWFIVPWAEHSCVYYNVQNLAVLFAAGLISCTAVIL